ncbi:hypothetical protein MSUIS_00940 [Mycoplasma suis KI3806]|uniref:Uncharacterized protein n=1 Tax=Mycoplasma suis (strain KI_3806) TaxID=708248 RepID=F0V2W5_MYCS3|nr:hypothetical protein [Mycoplasma suis]CBZ40187.1 hypothetical protein MSUIS_00940 [Mycoplasma suis KI3806]
MSGDETNQKPEDSSSVTSTSENVGVQATNLQESPETNRDAEVITSEDGGTHEQSTISDSSGVQKDLQVGTEKTEPDSQKQEPLPLTSVISSTPSPVNHSQSGEFSSGRRDSNYQFGGNVNGELIFPKINSEGESICVVASEGIGKELEDLEKCKNMVSQYLKNVEQGQEKIWMKVKEKNHVKKIFETLDPSNNNISLENDFEVNLLYDKFSCKINSEEENTEIVVSCLKKLNSE